MVKTNFYTKTMGENVMDEHIPSLDKIDKLRKDMITLPQNKIILGLKEDIEFVLSRIEMIEDKINQIVYVENKYEIPPLGIIKKNTLRYCKHIKGVLK
jgi:hypothetical protein